MATGVATKADDQFMDWLRDAHAVEEQAVTMLNKTAGRLENYPDLRAKIEQHAEKFLISQPCCGTSGTSAVAFCSGYTAADSPARAVRKPAGDAASGDAASRM